MSQNKTIIPGYEPSNGNGDSMGGFYSRSESDIDRSKTYVPGIYKSAAQEIMDEQAPQTKGGLQFQDRTIVGALFSISRFPTGEIFPIYIGRNTIGSDRDSDVFLPEETVSPNHAVMLVRSVEGEMVERGLKIYLTDYDSEYGTRIGDVALEYEKLECHDRDVISVGSNYKLLLCLFDAERCGLRIADDFHLISKPAEEKTETNSFMPQENIGMSAPPTVSQPISAEEEFSFYSPTKQTEGDHSTNKTVLL